MATTADGVAPARGIPPRRSTSPASPASRAEQQARAEQLVRDTLADLPQFADVSTVGALGYRSIGDAAPASSTTSTRRYHRRRSFLDPNQPESLVYQVDGDQRTLVSAMFIANDEAARRPELVDFGGPLMQWHVHDNLCWELDDSGKPGGQPGITDDDGNCPPGTVKAGGENPMVHVWIAPHECGPFAALEGHGAGQAAGDGQRADQCAHDHDAADDERDRSTPDAVRPDQPIDLGGVAGVTPAAAGVRREPRRPHAFATCRSGPTPPSPRPPASTRSATAPTGHEHYIQWDWIDDDVWLDPDHPESLVYEPQPDGIEEARVGDVHAAARRRRSTTCPTGAAR